MALLCGHASTISDLSPCSSTESDLHGAKALLSVCADGVLCVWTAGSGRCRRRRKLPPWAGSPSLVSPLPSSPRYACIICTSPDSVGHHAHEGSKYAVVIVDSWSLNVLRTVFHGGLLIGPVKSMMVIPLLDDGGQKRHEVILVDGHGKTQFFRVSEKEHDGEEASSPQRDSSSDATASISGRSFLDEPNAVAVAVSIDGKILALIWANYCVFKLVKDGATVGEIHLAGSSLLNECSSKKSQLIGGMFLREEDEQNPSEPEDLADGFTRRFFVWSNTGAGVVYMVSISDVTFKFQLQCEIPANPNMLDENKSVHFCQLNQCLVRAESLCFRVGGSLVWKPVITNWSIKKSSGMVDDRPCATEMLGEGSFSVEPAFAIMNPVGEGTEKNIQDSCLGYSSGSSGKYDDDSSDFFGVNNAVSSSMVLSKDLYGPYAVVYGFYNGQIEICQFVNVFHEKNSYPGRSNNSNYLQISERVFDGHTGAVLCLAAHHMTAYSEELTFHNVLISGSMDCTTRIWNMDTGNLILVMHHHVAPIRQIILPPTWTCHPWNNCFLSVGEDCCVALVSLETLRVERMFPGHPSYPSMVAWDCTKGYVACLCRNLQSLSDAVSVLYLWDVKTGVRERIIRGTASQSMFDHFCRGIHKNSITGTILGGTTSASSLHLSAPKDAIISLSNAKPEAGAILPKIVKSHRSMDSFDSNTNQLEHAKARKPILMHAPNACDVDHDLARNISTSQTKSQRASRKRHPVKCSCPFPGIAVLKFDLSSLMFPLSKQNSDKQMNFQVSENDITEPSGRHKSSTFNSQGPDSSLIKGSLEGHILRFSLCFLHLWDVDDELDKLLEDEMHICKPEGCRIGAGVIGDRGSLTLMFPGLCSTLKVIASD